MFVVRYRFKKLVIAASLTAWTLSSLTAAVEAKHGHHEDANQTSTTSNFNSAYGTGVTLPPSGSTTPSLNLMPTNTLSTRPYASNSNGQSGSTGGSVYYPAQNSSQWANTGTSVGLMTDQNSGLNSGINSGSNASSSAFNGSYQEQTNQSNQLNASASSIAASQVATSQTGSGLASTVANTATTAASAALSSFTGGAAGSGGPPKFPQWNKKFSPLPPGSQYSTQGGVNAQFPGWDQTFSPLPGDSFGTTGGTALDSAASAAGSAASSAATGSDMVP